VRGWEAYGNVDGGGSFRYYNSRSTASNGAQGHAARTLGCMSKDRSSAVSGSEKEAEDGPGANEMAAGRIWHAFAARASSAVFASFPESRVARSPGIGIAAQQGDMEKAVNDERATLRAPRSTPRLFFYLSALSRRCEHVRG